MYELELFAGAGGGILGKNLLGHRTVGAVEIDPYCRRILIQRQRDLRCPMFPVWDDVRTFRIDNPECEGYIKWLRSIADRLVISGGFPCQDISPCGKGMGITGKKSGLWNEMARIIGEIRPKKAFMENSPYLCARGLEKVLASLAEMGYDARWCVLGAGHLGYPIARERVWILGSRDGFDGVGSEPTRIESGYLEKYLWRSKTLYGRNDIIKNRLLADGLICRVPDGVADRMERIRAIGNGQVPSVVAIAWETLNR